MAKQIKGSDIIEPRHLEEAVQQAKQLKDAYLQLDKQVKSTSSSLKSISKTAVGGNVNEIKLITEAYNKSNAVKKSASDITNQLRAAEDEEVKAKLRLQQATATQKKLLTEEIALENKQIGTLQKLNIENNKLRREREKLNLETREGVKRMQEINVQLNKNNDIIKKSSDTLKQQKLNVGNYTSAVSKLTSVLGQLGLAFSAFSVVRNAFNTMVDFEKATASLSAITGATGDELIDLKSKVMELSETMKISATDATKLFEIVGSQMPQLLKDAEGLKTVAESAVILSKASGDTVEESTLALSNVMNQFSLGADQAERAMNVLAAGSLVGSAGIADVSEAMKNFGSVASGANISVEESVALIEVLGKYGVTGAESGTKLRGSILKLQQASFGYASGQFEVNDALDEARIKMESLGSEMEKDAFLQKTFGAENISTGRILLSNIGLFEEYTKGVTGTNTATEQAAINSDTMATVVKELQAAWTNLVVKWSDGTNVLGGLKDVLRFVADNLESIISWVVKGITVWASYRIALTLVNKEGTGLVQVLGNMIKGLANADKGIKNIKVSFASWVGLAAALLPMLWDMVKATYEMYSTTSALDKATEKYNVKIDEERAKMDLLRVQILATNAGSEERQVLIDKINSTYGTTLQNLSDETEFMNALALAYKEVNAQMEQKIMSEILQEDLTEAYKVKRGLEKGQAELGDRTFFNAMVWDTYQKGIDETTQSIKDLQKEMFNIGVNPIGASKYGLAGKMGGKAPFDASEDVKKTTKEVKKLQDGIIKLDGSLEKMFKVDGFTELQKKGFGKAIESLGGGVDLSQFDPKGETYYDYASKLAADALRKIAEEEKKAAEQRKKMALESIELLKKVTDARISEMDREIEKEKELISESKTREDELRVLAQQGNTDAAESIKSEQIARAKQELEIEKLEKKKRNLLILTTGLESASQKINAGDSNAFKNAGSEIAEFIAKLPKFFEGSGTTIAESLGKPQLSGRDGYIVRVDGSEKVLNPEQSAMTGSMTTDEIANAALMYRTNKVISGKVMGYSSSVSDARIVNKLDAVEKAIKSIPNHQFNFDEQNKMFVHTVKEGNKITRNHHKVGGLFS